MKKYNTPEIEALALETIDVIAASNGEEPVAGLTAGEKLTEAGYNKTDVTFGAWNW